jgi:methylase of polypeptide subunit release factors
MYQHFTQDETTGIITPTSDHTLVKCNIALSVIDDDVESVLDAGTCEGAVACTVAQSREHVVIDALNICEEEISEQVPRWETGERVKDECV